MNSQQLIVLQNGMNTFGSSSNLEYSSPLFLSELSFQILCQEDRFQLMVLGQDKILVNGKKSDIKSLVLGDVLEFAECKWTLDQKAKSAENLNIQGVSTLIQSTDSKSLIVLLKAIENLFETESPAHLFEKLIEFLCLQMGADQGRIELNSPCEIWNWPQSDWDLSQTKVKESLEKQSIVIWNQTEESEKDLSLSIVKNRISSLIAAPLTLANGFIYLQRIGEKSAFTQSDSELFLAGVSLAESVLKNFRKKAEMTQQIEALTGIQHDFGLIWQCDVMSRLVQMAKKVAQMPVPILIQGQTGTGKEVLASFIHKYSERRDLPFIAINCGAIPENLIESELFGHTKGAFTGAHENKQGLFERVKGGTLFLDEVGELPLMMQVKLLRVLQERKLTPLGSSQEISVDFRLISATHIDLEKAVEAGRFREDLFFRINLMTLHLPALSERGTDVILIAQELIRHFAVEFNIPVPELSREAEKSLLVHSWKGNVRELKNRIQKALILCSNQVIHSEDLGLSHESHSGVKPKMLLKDAKEALEKEYILTALKDAEANLTLAGQILGIDRKVLRDLMLKHEIDKENFK